MQQTTNGLLIPFALSSTGHIVGVDEVKRGLACQCTCLDCGEALVARRGTVLRPHFAHLPTAGPCSSTSEGILHQTAKRALANSVGKVVLLGIPKYLAVLTGAREEYRLPNGSRVIDVMASIEWRRRTLGRKLRDLETLAKTDVAIEVMVSHAKDSDYCQDMQRLSLPAYEKVISLDELYRVHQQQSLSLMSAMKRLVLSSNTGHWLAIAGLPDAIASTIDYDRYQGDPHHLLNRAAKALQSGEPALAEALVDVAQRNCHEWPSDAIVRLRVAQKKLSTSAG